MSNRIQTATLVGILVFLAIIAFKPVPQLSVNGQPQVSQPQVINQINPGQSIIQLGPNRIAVVDTRSNSGLYGAILVFDYNEGKHTFDFTGKFNYSDYFRNPNKYGIEMH